MESKPLHTKGPWAYDQSPASATFGNIVSAGGTAIARPKTLGSGDATAANIALIAAAPDMFEAAAWMLALIDGGEEMPKPGDDVAEALRRAISGAAAPDTAA